MMRIFLISFYFIIFSCTAYNQTIKSQVDSPDKLSIQETDNLLAFAKLYGYMKFFCPNKLTKDIDWDKYAIYGCRQVADAPNDSILVIRLQQLSYPLTKDVAIYSNKIKTDTNENTINHSVFNRYAYYNHKGCGIGMNYLYRKISGYKSTVIKKLYINRNIEKEKDLLNKNVYQIGKQVFLQMPLAHKWNISSNGYYELKKSIDTIIVDNYGFRNINKRSHRLATLIIIWSQIEHFFPNPLDRNIWENGLIEALNKASEDTTLLDFYYTVGKMTSLLNDFHAMHYATYSINKFAGGYIPIYAPAIEFKLIEGHLMIGKVSKEYDSLISKGDEVSAINNLPSCEFIDQRKKYYSASTTNALELKVLWNLFYTYKKDSIIKMQILKPDSSLINLDVKTNIKGGYHSNDTSMYLKIIDDSIGYVNFTSSNFSYKDYKKFLKHNKQLKAIICDVRGYPTYKKKTLSHFTKKTIQSTNFEYPIIKYPDYTNVLYYSTNWKIKPRKPYINYKVVFLTDENAGSWAETFMDFVKYYHLGTIIGNYTNGTNGNVSSYSLPIFKFRYTGMRVLQHNGDSLVGIGIKPDIFIRPTQNGYIQGKDEVLDKALETIKNNQYLNEKKND